MQHTSCALSLNENWDEDVRRDMSDALDKIVVEDKVRSPIFPFPHSLFLFLFLFFIFFMCIPQLGKEGELGEGGDSIVSFYIDFLFDISRTKNQMPPHSLGLSHKTPLPLTKEEFFFVFFCFFQKIVNTERRATR